VPTLSKATLGGSVVKLHAEIGSADDGAGDATVSATYLRRLTRRSFIRAWRLGARYALAHGLDASQDRAQALEARTDERASFLEAMLPPRAAHKPVKTWGRGWE
jgi:hypothetical protein